MLAFLCVAPCRKVGVPGGDRCVRDASEALQLLWGGLEVARYNIKGKEYDVIAQLERERRLVPSSLENIALRTRDGRFIPASSILIPSEQGSPNAINRFARLPLHLSTTYWCPLTSPRCCWFYASADAAFEASGWCQLLGSTKHTTKS